MFLCTPRRKSTDLRDGLFQQKYIWKDWTPLYDGKKEKLIVPSLQQRFHLLQRQYTHETYPTQRDKRCCSHSYFSKHSTKALITASILHPNIIHSSQWADMLNAQLVAEEGARQKRTQWKKHTWPRPKPLQLNYDCLASKRGCVHSLR